MADSIATKKTTALTAKTMLDDTDLFIIGNAGTSELRRINFSNLKKVLSNALLGATLHTHENNGVTIRIYESPAMIRIKASGSATGAFGTSSAYATFGTINATSLLPAVKKIVCATGYTATLRVNAEGGKVQVGYTRKIGDDTAANIPAGTNILIDETIMLV